MITQMRLAELLYEGNPSPIEKILDDRPSHMSWDDALENRTLEAQSAVLEAQRLLRHIVKEAAVTMEDVEKARGVASSLMSVGLLGPSRGGIPKITADLMCDGSKYISALLIALDAGTKAQ